MNATIAVMRAIEARICLVVVRTADEDGLTEKLRWVLHGSGHRIYEWTPILGALESKTTQKNLTLPQVWDQSKAGVVPIQEWTTKIAAGDDGTKFCPDLHCAGVEDPRPRLFPNGFDGTCPDCNTELAFSPRTLILRGLAPWIVESAPNHDVMYVRGLWEIAQLNKVLLTNLIVVLPLSAKLPASLVEVSVDIEDCLPSRDEIMTDYCKAFFTGISGKRRFVFDGVNTESVGFRAKVADRLTGLSSDQIRNALNQGLISASYVESARIETFLGVLEKQKADGLRQSAALETIRPGRMEDIGGLDNLKGWLKRRAMTLSPEARAQGIPPAKGCVLLGPPGSGKSASAKAIAQVMNLPLYRFDIGSVFGSLVGQSEEQMRKALAAVDAAAPCVVMVEEVDKALTGAGAGGTHDGGTTQRVFGTLLTWLQERAYAGKPPAFFVMSANDIRGLPPEFLRQGRLDAIWFVDLPTTAERKVIFEIHLRRAVEAGGKFTPFTEAEVASLADITPDFTGAEIEQAIVEGRISAFNEGVPLNVNHVRAAVARTKPLARTMSQRIEEVRSWAKDRAMLASAPDDTPTPAAPKPLKLFGLKGLPS